MAMRELSWKQRLFCAEYLARRMNGTQAAIAAGYRPSNARFYASRLLTKANVRAELARQAKAAIDRLNARRQAEGMSEVTGSFDLSRLPVVGTRLVQNRAGELVTANVRAGSGALLRSTWTPRPASLPEE